MKKLLLILPIIFSISSQAQSTLAMRLGAAYGIFKPYQAEEIKNFKIIQPAFFIGFSREHFDSESKMIITTDFQVSYFDGSFDSGKCRINKYDFQIGIGKKFKHIKLSVAIGLSSVDFQYIQDGSHLFNSFLEYRSGFTTSLNAEIILRERQNSYLGLFIQPNIMIGRPANTVHQLNVELKWMPDFSWVRKKYYRH